jgi:hypothetical protein
MEFQIRLQIETLLPDTLSVLDLISDNAELLISYRSALGKDGLLGIYDQHRDTEMLTSVWEAIMRIISGSS